MLIFFMFLENKKFADKLQNDNQKTTKMQNNIKSTIPLPPHPNPKKNNKKPYTSAFFFPFFASFNALCRILKFNSFSKKCLISFAVQLLSSLSKNTENFAGETFLNCESCSNLEILSINKNFKSKVKVICTNTTKRDQLNLIYFSLNS